MTERERLGPPPIEPLSEAVWTRVERGLWSRLDAEHGGAEAPARPGLRARRWAWIAAPAFAAAAAAVAIAVVVPRGGPEDDAAEAPARIVSGAAPTSLTFADVHVTLDAESAVVMSRPPAALLERGAAWFAVAPRGDQPPFVVTAGDTIVRVVGTRFRVARSGEDATVEVEHGLVEVQFRGATARVGAGHRWSSREPRATARLAAAELPAPAAPEAPPAAAAPDAAAPEAPPPATVLEPAAGAGPRPPGPAASPRPAPAVPGPGDAAARYRRLEAVEARDPASAIRGYLELSRSATPWAAPALFAAARLSADRREPRARVLLQTYLQRYPDGANAADARTLLDSLPGASR